MNIPKVLKISNNSFLTTVWKVHTTMIKCEDYWMSLWFKWTQNILLKNPSSDGAGKYGSNHYYKHVQYSSDEKHRIW